MAASISFNDGSGVQTITPSSAKNRLNKWRPRPMTIGERAIAVGDGAGYHWAHRTDYGGSFELPNIPNTQEAVLQDFLLHANAFGLFTITTTDSESNSYSSCQIAPGTFMELSDPDPETLEYTLSGTVINLAASPTPLRVVY